MNHCKLGTTHTMKETEMFVLNTKEGNTGGMVKLRHNIYWEK